MLFFALFVFSNINENVTQDIGEKQLVSYTNTESGLSLPKSNSHGTKLCVQSTIRGVFETFIKKGLKVLAFCPAYG